MSKLKAGRVSIEKIDNGYVLTVFRGCISDMDNRVDSEDRAFYIDLKSLVAELHEEIDTWEE